MFNTKSAKGRDAQTGARSLAKIDEIEQRIAEEKAPAAKSDESTSAKNIIGQGTVIEGNISAEGDLLIEGRVKGDVTTKTSLSVGPNAVIEGNILANHADIGGQVTGSVRALGLLVIKASSTIMGDVMTRNLNVEAGSTFNGRFQVGGTMQTIDPAKKAAPVAAAVVPAVPVAAKPVDAPK